MPDQPLNVYQFEIIASGTVDRSNEADPVEEK